MDPNAVFACNRLDLRKIEVYGFDYDYTLAHYKPELEELIYNLGREALLMKFKVLIKIQYARLVLYKNTCIIQNCFFLTYLVSRGNKKLGIQPEFCSKGIAL